MAIVTEPRSGKEQLILDCALDLLKDTGDAGLTMRKIAERAGMRLSNVQYYFKSRDDVLKAMVEGYFDSCTEEIRQLIQDQDASVVRERLHLLIGAGLRHGDELSDMCRIFRELWAISSRNTAVRDHMTEYYRGFSELIADFILGETASPQLRGQICSLLLPFIEGYSVTAQATPLPTDRIAEMLTELAMDIIQRDGHSGS